MFRKILIGVAAAAAGMLFNAPPQAHAGLVQCRTTSSHTFLVAAAAHDKLCGFVHALEATGHSIAQIHGWRAHGSVPGSLHPIGMAIDICQTGRNRVNCGYDPWRFTALAHRFGLMSGCEFRRPDCGHFQVAGVHRDYAARHRYARAHHHRRHYTRSHHHYRHHYRRYAHRGPNQGG